MNTEHSQINSTDSNATQIPLAPHPVLTRHYSSAAERVHYIRQLFNHTAADYDHINSWMSFGHGEQYRKEALIRAGIKDGDTVLDCAAGTGVIAAHAQSLVGNTGQVIALDPSPAMLTIAQQRGVHCTVIGIAEYLPLPDNSVDLITMGYALRHVADLSVTFQEFARVLRPGGRLLILEMVPPPTRFGRIMSQFYLKHLVPTLAWLMTRRRDARRLMQYYWDTIDQCVAPAVVMTALETAGFIAVTRTVQLGLLTEYTATWSSDSD